MNLSGMIPTREEDVEAVGHCILADEDIENKEGDLIEEVAHDLED